MTPQDKLTRLLEILEHEHGGKCFREHQEDCGEHHAHSNECTTSKYLSCTYTDRYKTLVLSRATPAMLTLVEAARAAVEGCGRCGGPPGGGRIPGQRLPGNNIAPSVPCPQCGAIVAALDSLAQTDIRW